MKTATILVILVLTFSTAAAKDYDFPFIKLEDVYTGDDIIKDVLNQFSDKSKTEMNNSWLRFHGRNRKEKIYEAFRLLGGKPVMIWIKGSEGFIANYDLDKNSWLFVVEEPAWKFELWPDTEFFGAEVQRFFAINPKTKQQMILIPGPIVDGMLKRSFNGHYVICLQMYGK